MLTALTSDDWDSDDAMVLMIVRIERNMKINIMVALLVMPMSGDGDDNVKGLKKVCVIEQTWQWNA